MKLCLDSDSIVLDLDLSWTRQRWTYPTLVEIHKLIPDVCVTKTCVVVVFFIF